MAPCLRGEEVYIRTGRGLTLEDSTGAVRVFHACARACLSFLRRVQDGSAVKDDGLVDGDGSDYVAGCHWAEDGGKIGIVLVVANSWSDGGTVVRVRNVGVNLSGWSQSRSDLAMLVYFFQLLVQSTTAPTPTWQVL